MKVRTCVGRIASFAIVVSSLPSDASAQDCDGWVALHEIMPRSNPVMVDAGDGSVLLFGGSLSGQIPAQNLVTVTAETWRFDGERWRFVTTSGPSPRVRTAGAFDAARSTFVLFGGEGLTNTNGITRMNDTWEFVQGEWTLRTTSHAPSPRDGHAMVYDQSRNLTFLYGGTLATSKFLSYDGVDWTDISLTTPNPGNQINHKLVVDPRDNSIVLIPFTAASPCWKWDGTGWSQLPATQILPSSAFFDPSRNTIVLVSGQGLFYTYDGQGPAQLLAGILPPASTGEVYPTVVPQASGEWLTIVGPSANPTVPSPASYKVSATGWSPIETAKPRPTATVDIAFGYHTPTREFVVFGGTHALSSPQLAETWILRGETWREHTGTEPTARIGAYIAYSPQRDVSLLLGGNVSDTTLWSWNGSNWSSVPTGGIALTPGTPPDYDTQREAIFWPTTSSIRRIDETISALGAHHASTQNGAAAYDPIRGAFIFAGGQGSYNTYRLVDAASGIGFTWNIIAENDIIGRSGPRMAFDPDRQGLIFFGGSSGFSGGDLGTFPRKTYFLGSSATAWATLPLASNGPIGRKLQGMGYDPVARRIVMYGGLSLSTAAPLQETWKLARGPAAVALEPDETYVIPGETAEVFIIASGGGVIEYQWFKDGQPLANSARISGADSDTLQIQSFSSDDNGQYHVTVGNPCGQDQSITVQVRAIPACPGDFNDSGGVDASDLADFFDAYERGLMLADVDRSGGVDAGDIGVFIASFEAGGC